MFSIVLPIAIGFFALAFLLCVLADHEQNNTDNARELTRYRACTRACATPPHHPNAPVTRHKPRRRTKAVKMTWRPLTRLTWGWWML